MLSTLTDERQPLLSANSKLACVKPRSLIVHDPRKPAEVGDFHCDFDPNGDPENPEEWPGTFKWMITSLLVFMAFNVYACPYSIPLPSPSFSLMSKNTNG